MRVIVTVVLVLALAWMLMKYLDNQPKQVPRPIGVALEEPGEPEVVLH